MFSSLKSSGTLLGTLPLKSFSSFFFSSTIKLRIGLTKSGGLLCSKNNGLAKLSNGPCGIVTSLLVHDGDVTFSTDDSR